MDEDSFYKGVYRVVQDSGASGWYIRKSHELLEKNISNLESYKILEVGGNVGEHIPFVSENFESYLLTDYRDTGFESHDRRLTFQVADVQQLPFKSDMFDRTISTCLLHHLDDPQKALQEIRRVTTNEGQVSILLPCDPGLAYRIAKKIGPAKKWRAAGISNPSYYHYLQHRNHFPGLASIIQELYKTDKVQMNFWPLKAHSWNINLFVIYQIKVQKE